jgi:hypothetical protein
MYAGLRKTVKEAFDASGKDMNRDGGIYLLNKEQLATANKLFDDLSQYGMFVVRKGELETWLP